MAVMLQLPLRSQASNQLNILQFTLYGIISTNNRNNGFCKFREKHLC